MKYGVTVVQCFSAPVLCVICLVVPKEHVNITEVPALTEGHQQAQK